MMIKIPKTLYLIVALISWHPSATAEDNYKVTLKVVDAESNQPVAARVYLVAQDGTPLFFTSASPAGSAVRYEKQNWNNKQSIEYHTTVSAHPCETSVGKGKYRLTVERGQTWFPVNRVIEVHDDIEVTVPIKRWYDAASLGWYSGDTHIHRSIDDLRNIVLAEDLNVALPLTYWVTRAETPPTAGDKNVAGNIPKSLIEVDATHVIWPRSTEYEIFTTGGKRHTLGALFVPGHADPLRRGVPPWRPVIEQAIASGAALDMDKLDWPFSMLLPTLAPNALYELANNHMWRTEFGFRRWNSPTPGFLQPPFGDVQGGEREWIDYTFGMYYALLNCGLKLPPTAGTASGVHPVPAGFSRVYVHVPDPFSYDAWFAGLKAGRSFVSTGPMLIARADGELPGKQFELPESSSREFSVEIDVSSETPISYGELIVNGQPQKLLRATSTKTPSGAHSAKLQAAINVDRSSWFAVRVWENRDGGRVRFAHTAPWHVKVGDQPVQIPAQERNYLVQRMKAEIERSQEVLDAPALAEYYEALKFYEARPVADDREQIGNQARPLSTGGDRDKWLTNMIAHHRFTADELRLATGLSLEESQREIARIGEAPPSEPGNELLVLPYPGGRHPRRGFLDGAIDPQRETKISIFPPWENGGYVVIDVPEAIFSNLGLTYLAHTHIPTIWNQQGVTLPKLEWKQDGKAWSAERELPNGIKFGSQVTPQSSHVAMQMWLHNGTDSELTGLRSQVCVMLKGAAGFQSQNELQNVERKPFIAIRAVNQDRWIINAWEPCQRVWNNPPVPCVHSDPIFPDCPPNETVRVQGYCWFYEGIDIDAQLEKLAAEYF